MLGLRSDAEDLGEAEAVGFPLLVKASAGGGGKGMGRPAPQMAGGLAPFMMGMF